MGSLSRSSLFSRLIGHAVDGLFWCVDELVRWWEIGRLTMEIKTLRRHRSNLLKKVGSVDDVSDSANSSTPPDADREDLIRLSEEISRIAGREDFLRKRSWALTPELLLLGIVLIFIGGIFWLRPRTDAILTLSAPVANVQSAVTLLREAPLPDHQVVTTAAWFGSRLYVGGDGGLTVIDPATGIATSVPALPAGFFVRHLVDEGTRLLIAGYGGVFTLDAAGLQTLYDGSKLPASMINRIAPIKGGHLLGSIGQGLLHGRNGLGMMVLGTQDLTITGFARFDGELWLLHERGLLKGDGTQFSSISLPVLTGRRLSSIAADGEALYLGTDEGVIAGYKNAGSWVWTPLASGGPRKVTDLIVSSGTLLVMSSEGLYRRKEGRFEKLADAGQGTVIALGSNLLAIAGPRRVSFFGFAANPGEAAANIPTVRVIPVIGSYSVDQPPAANMSPIPGINPVPSAPAPSLPAGAAPSSGNSTSAFFNMTTLPTSLTTQFVSALAWDGSRLWTGTANDGLWRFSDNTWTGFSTSNGGLTDNQIVSLFQLQGKTFLYSWMLGIMTLDSGRPVPLIPPSSISGLIGVSGDPANPLILFEDGRLRRFAGPGKFDEIGRIPEDYFTSIRSLQVVSGSPLIVTDQGILVRESPTHWILIRYPDSHPSSVKAVLSTIGQEGVIYVALSDGTIYSFASASKQITKIGILEERPRAIAFGKTLWAATFKSLYQATPNGLVRISAAEGLGIVGIQPIIEKNVLILATSLGLRSLPISF
ncbi:MAG: hypothetical protein HQM09_08985 [Candidatus Riflebacteria bacterium]|nr:hypothetical protein [Candidatus Riflebacteria bacterium]